MYNKLSLLLFSIFIFSIPSVCFSQSAKDALKALKKLEAKTQVGISYRDYSPALGDAKYEVNLYIEGDEKYKNKEFKSAIIEAMNLYEYANTIWFAKFTREASHGFIIIDDPALSTSKMIADDYFSRYPEDRKDESEGGVLSNELGGKMHVGVAVGKIWGRASKELDKASKLLPTDSPKKPKRN